MTQAVTTVTKIPKAPRNASGEVILTSGVQYYIDVPSDEQYIEAFKSLAKLPLKEHDTLKSGRGPIMASFTATKNILIPKSLAVLTGHWFLSEGRPLNVIQRQLYGNQYDAPENFWEYLSNANPSLFNVGVKAAEKVKAAAEGISDTVKLIAGAAALGVLLAVFVYASNVTKKLPLPDEEPDEIEEDES